MNDNWLNNNNFDNNWLNNNFDNNGLNNNFDNNGLNNNFDNNGLNNNIFDNNGLNNNVPNNYGFDDNNSLFDDELNNNLPKTFEIILCENENDLILKFTNFISSFNLNKTRLMHWSFAEPTIFNKKCNIVLPWFDLLKIFKYPEYPIIIKDCHGFGIKKVVNSLNKHGLINLKWNDLDDGLLSAFIAKDIYDGKVVDNENCCKIVNELIDYNSIDCMALNVLIDFLRNFKFL